ncbi:MAG: hypothetical protein IT233_05225 [Bacteroidia bacterium]|nr:hypothetical protein [Bacteroidia bacterium]
MKRLLFFTLFIPAVLISQKGNQKTADKILEDGQVLYTLEMASVTSLDVFYDKEYDPKLAKGYFSYFDKDTIKTVFYRELDTTTALFKANDSLRKMIKDKFDLLIVSKTMRYLNKSINKSKVFVFENDRKITDYEKKLFDIRFKIFKVFNDDPATFIKYEKSSLSIVIRDQKKYFEAYVMNVFRDMSFVPLGNDYYFKFDKEGNMIEKKVLHKSFIPLDPKYYGKKNDEIKSSFHNHKGEGAEEFITPTDICVLLLFKPMCQWDMHYVYGDKFVSVFNMYKNTLSIIDKKSFESQTKPKEDPDDLDNQIKKEK